MGSYTWQTSGTDEQAARERDRLNTIGALLDYSPRRGAGAGRKASTDVLRDLAEGRAAVAPVADAKDREWIAAQLVQLAEQHPEHGLAIHAIVDGLRIADRLADLGPVG